MEAAIETRRLTLRLIRRDDAPDVVRTVFEEPETTAMLAHDGSTAEARRAAAERWCGLGPDGGHAPAATLGLGLFAILDRGGALERDGAFLGVAGLALAQTEGRWGGELFYALARAHHGKGVMREACAAILARFDATPGAGELFALYWRLLNPASGRLLRRLGFVDAGVRPLRDGYGLEKLLGIRRFELWRLETAPGSDARRVLESVAIKLGHLAAEAVLAAGEARAEIDAALARRGDDPPATAAEIDAWLAIGLEEPPQAYLTRGPVG